MGLWSLGEELSGAQGREKVCQKGSGHDCASCAVVLAWRQARVWREQGRASSRDVTVSPFIHHLSLLDNLLCSVSDQGVPHQQVELQQVLKHAVSSVGIEPGLI